MKILVLSDSHSALSFMRRCIETVGPDAVVHLGDYYEDAEAMKEEFPGTPFYMVPGNCDRYRFVCGAPEILTDRVCGVRLYMTHGHLHKVKQTRTFLLRDARAGHVDGVLYGHTHQAECTREEDGLWVLNPGSCGYYGGSAGLIETENGSIRNCRILREGDLEQLSTR